MRLSARRLELYGLPGSGTAAVEISKAITEATKRVFKMSSRDVRVKILARHTASAWESVVYPALCDHTEFGATDTEPRAVSLQELADRVCRRAQLDYDETQDFLSAIYQLV